MYTDALVEMTADFAEKLGEYDDAIEQLAKR